MPKFSVKKPFTIFVAVIAILVLGIVSYTKMTPDLLPNMDFPYVMIMTTYPVQTRNGWRQRSPDLWNSPWLRWNILRK